MYSCIFDPRSTCCLDGLHYFVLHIFFSRLSARRLLLPFILYPPSGSAGICPLGLFCFTRRIPNTFYFQQKTWRLRSVLGVSRFSSFCPTFSRGGSVVVRKFLIVLPMFSKKGLQIFWWTCWISPHKMDFFVPSNIFGGSPPLLPGFLIITHSSGSYFFGIYIPCSPRSLWGFMKLLEGLLHNCKQRTGKSAPLLLFPLSYDIDGVKRLFPFSPMGFLFKMSFLVLCEEETIK